jgi:ribonuclease HII
VLAAAAILPAGPLPRALDGLIRDSKTLSRTQREALAPLIAAHGWVALGEADVGEIDRFNILNAALLAMTRAVTALGIEPGYALVDGNRLPSLPCPARAVVKGDGLSLSIAAASIVAKVARDARMAELARAFPGYGWERNAGYGTAEHLDGLRRLGATPHHRRSFAPVAAAGPKAIEPL